MIAVQVNVSAAGYPVAIDGYYGQETYTAIKNYQASRGLQVDGCVGPNTWSAMQADLVFIQRDVVGYEYYYYLNNPNAEYIWDRCSWHVRINQANEYLVDHGWPQNIYCV